MKISKMRVRGLKAVYVVPVVIVTFAIIACTFHVPQRIIFNFKEWRHSQEWQSRSLWLPEYRVEIEALPVRGVTENLSGLTWNNETKTLFAVINDPPEIVELSTTGAILRRIQLQGFDDPEAVEYIGSGQYIVADEKGQQIICVAIDAETTEIRAEGLQRLSLDMGPVKNEGIEGLAWDLANRRLYAAKERNPVHIYEITGFPQEPNTTMDITVASNRIRDRRLFISDVSSLVFNSRYQHLLVLSHESKLIIEVDKSGSPISSLSLLMGHGLAKPVPQAEGMAMDDADTLYLVSEPNLFYVFRRQHEE
ncbi:SdiA-regulated domain-containing protein [Desulfosarcina sp. OttesenSCG-928-A07]|nr:SdiA-regulated domain-containing protein [Desulfosarcina sp. OttesenSCG-928-G17]MDL2329323.1 SdiA-regulated domain-containing protein [Desulfosarcina sp. OttesenSCG-928-A07]